MQNIKINKINFIYLLVTLLLFLVTFVENLEFGLYKNIKDIIIILLLVVSICFILSKNKLNMQKLIKPLFFFFLTLTVCIFNSNKSLVLTKPIMSGLRFMLFTHMFLTKLVIKNLSNGCYPFL